MRESDRRILAKQAAARKTAHGMQRTSQIIFGERQDLVDVHAMLRQTLRDKPRLKRECKALESLIAARTAELNRINANWDRKIKQAMNRRAKADQLARMAVNTPPSDYLLLRTISEHPNTPAFVLAELAHHPYDAIRENVARHPNTDSGTLTRLAKTRGEPLWYLLAFNPNTPPELREKLHERIKRAGAPRARRVIVS